MKQKAEIKIKHLRAITRKIDRFAERLDIFVDDLANYSDEVKCKINELSGDD
jgi:hypothetical protein